MSLITELNSAQSLIYSRSNIRRAYQDFDDSDIAGINLDDQSCLVVRTDGTQQTYERQLITEAFVGYTKRLKDFFAYLGPNYRGPSIWHNSCYILFKGWHYGHALGHLSSNAKLQRHWADRFIHLTDETKLIALLQSDQTDLGHLVAPEGVQLAEQLVELDREATDEQDNPAPALEPWCSCGSFQRQLNDLSFFQQEIEGYKPTCIHLTWIHKFREFLANRTKAREESRTGTPEKCVAWWYAPPSDHHGCGRFVLLHTKYGSHAPRTHWRAYKPDEVFTQKDAWDLFDSMMASGYVPFPGTSLPQLASVVKKPA